MSTPRAIVQLERCPQCDYDLSALPCPHTCPECGLEYDGDMFVLEGKPPSGTYWDNQVVGVFMAWFGIGLLFFAGRMGAPRFAAFMAISFAAICIGAWVLQRYRQRPGKALLIWVSALGIATQPAFRWKPRRRWSFYRRVNLSRRHALADFRVPRSKLPQWRLRVLPRWGNSLLYPPLDVVIRCTRTEAALVRNTMRRLHRRARH